MHESQLYRFQVSTNQGSSMAQGEYNLGDKSPVVFMEASLQICKAMHIIIGFIVFYFTSSYSHS